MKYQSFDKDSFWQEEHSEYLATLRDHVARSRYLPRYHLVPPTGWMGRPGGLFCWEGMYHVFYQWWPFAPERGREHCAHVCSRDLLRWEWEGLALTPDQPGEEGGVHLGNALFWRNLLYIYYSTEQVNSSKTCSQIAIASMDSVGTVVKYAGNPVLAVSIPGQKGRLHSPCVFFREDYYWMLLASARDEKADIVLFSSSNLVHWEYEGVVQIGLPLGKIDSLGMVPVEGGDLLLISSQNGAPDEGAKKAQECRYAVGKLDINALRFDVESQGDVDASRDFYAPQPLIGAAGQTMMLGWLGGEDAEQPTDADGWRHGLTMPRKIWIEQGNLCTRAASEIDAGFGAVQPLQGASMMAESRAFRLRVSCAPEDNEWTICFGGDADHWRVSVDFAHREMIVDRRGMAAFAGEEVMRREGWPESVERTIDIYVDHTIVEIFAFGGSVAFGFRVFHAEGETLAIQSDRPMTGEISYYLA